jgi:hypothetical protein
MTTCRAGIGQEFRDRIASVGHTRDGQATLVPNEESAMKNRLRQVVSLVLAVLVSVGVAAAAGAIALYAAGPSGIVSCVSPTGEDAEPIQRWIFFAGAPALLATFVALFFGLALQRVLFRMIGVLLALGLGVATFSLVYALLPPECRPA